MPSTEEKALYFIVGVVLAFTGNILLRYMYDKANPNFIVDIITDIVGLFLVMYSGLLFVKSSGD